MPICSQAPEAPFFNLNGHTYKGRDHWFRLWEFYGRNVDSSYWTPFDIGGVVSTTMAVVWCHRQDRRQWTGKEPPPQGDQLRQRRIHLPLDHGVPQGRRPVARRAYAFFEASAGALPAAFRPGRPRGRLVREGDVSDLPNLSVRLHGGIEPGRCITRPDGRSARLSLRLVRRERFRRGCCRRRRPARGHEPDRHRHRRVQSLQPPSHVDRHGDRRARRTGAGPCGLGIGSGSRRPRAHGIERRSSARRRARRDHDRARNAQGRRGDLHREGVLRDRVKLEYQPPRPDMPISWQPEASRRWRCAERSPTA